MATESREAITNALRLLGRANNNETAILAGNTNTLPTGKTRSVLDFLVASTQEELKNQELNLREMTESLFNWHGEKRATKALLHAFNNAIMTEGKYAEAVEVTAYVAALAPLMEPDRLARIFGAIHEVRNAYAPARYTVSLYKKLNALLSRYPEERRATLAYSLWVEAHQGRWWDMTAGDQQEGVNQEPGEVENHTTKELVDAFCGMTLPWSEASRQQIITLKEKTYGLMIRDALDRYNNMLLEDKPVDPDFAVYAASISWLTPLERPESPIGSLADVALELPEIIGDYRYPAKPKKFSDLFPNINLYGGDRLTFPYNNVIRASHGLKVDHIDFALISNPAQLAENRTYMGNCTWTLRRGMEQGTTLLYKLIYQGQTYNASAYASTTQTRGGKAWRVGEINSRYNRGGVPDKVRQAFTAFISNLPANTLAEAPATATKLKKRLKVSYKL